LNSPLNCYRGGSHLEAAEVGFGLDSFRVLGRGTFCKQLDVVTILPVQITCPFIPYIVCRHPSPSVINQLR